MEPRTIEMLKMTIDTDESTKAKSDEIIDAIKAIVSGITKEKQEQTSDYRLFTFTAAAEILGISRTTIWRLVREGRIATKEIRRGSNRISAAELARFAGGAK